MKDFRNLKVWERSHRLTLSVYRETRMFPQDERFGLTSQLRRATASIAANIAEGCGRRGDAELARFFQIAMGSASETEYHLILARDLEYLSAQAYEDLNQQLTETKRMLNAFLQKLRAKC